MIISFIKFHVGHQRGKWGIRGRELQWGLVGSRLDDVERLDVIEVGDGGVEL